MREINKNEYSIRKATWDKTSPSKFKRDLVLIYNNKPYILNCSENDEIALYEEEGNIYIIYINQKENYSGLQFFGLIYDDNIREDKIEYPEKEILLYYFIGELLWKKCYY